MTVGTVTASAERAIAAPPDTVLALLRDYRDVRPRLLPDAYADYRVEAGGEGAGTIVAYTLHAARRVRAYRLAVTEPETGPALREDDETSSFAQTWTLEPAGDGTRVRLACSWTGASGIGGFFERTFAPKGVARLSEEILDRLEREAAPRTT